MRTLPLRASGSYAGRTLAPNAGRIRGGALMICGRKHSLAPNDGQNQLHGGKHNLSFTDWDIEELEEAPDYVKLSFTATQPDGLDGFPGNRRYHVSYIIEDTNWIRIEYRAESDQPTYVNLSNHTYWNLAGSEWVPEIGAGLRQELEIAANNVVLNDAASLPADVIPVAGTAFDFRVPVSLRHMLDSEILRDRTSIEQFQTGLGFNNAYILTRADLRRHLRGVRHEEPLKKACTLRDPVSGFRASDDHDDRRHGPRALLRRLPADPELPHRPRSTGHPGCQSSPPGTDDAHHPGESILQGDPL